MGGSKECYIFKNGKICPYMEKWGDRKFEHGREKGRKDERDGRGKG